MERFRLYGPGAKVGQDTLESVRRERDHLCVVDIRVLSLGGAVREVCLTGVVDEDMNAGEFIEAARAGLRIPEESHLSLATVVDYDQPFLKSEMARQKQVVLLEIDKGHVVEDKEMKIGASEGLPVMAKRSGDHFYLGIKVLSRETGSQKGSGGDWRVEALSSLLFGEGYWSTAGSLFRELVRGSELTKSIVGNHHDYVVFLILPEEFKMGCLPVAGLENERYWRSRAIIQTIMVPKELV